jgi:hypothetical protein
METSILWTALEGFFVATASCAGDDEDLGRAAGRSALTGTGALVSTGGAATAASGASALDQLFRIVGPVMTPRANTATTPAVSKPDLATVIPSSLSEQRRSPRASQSNKARVALGATVEQPHVHVIHCNECVTFDFLFARSGQVQPAQEVGGTTSVATEGLGMSR